jgi:hypothetical protein
VTTAVPPDDQLAAIVAAVEVAWPKPVVVAEGDCDGRPPTPVWRFSARWWRRPIAARRERPW